MRDPIDELDHFDSREPPVTPLPAAEVRRRGDRLRRRRQVAAAIGAAAAVAIVATPVAVFAGHDQDDSAAPITSPTPSVGPAEPSPGPTSRWIQQIPADFPLAAGLPGTPSPVDRRFATGVCTGSTGAPVVDMQSVTSTPDTEGSYDRSLALFVDEDVAASIVDGLRADLAACTAAPESSVRRVVTPPDGDHLGWVVLERDSDGQLDGQGEIVEVFRVGNAVLTLGSTVSSAGDAAVVHHQASRTAADAGEPLGLMCTFSQDGCPSSSAPSSVAAPDSTDIPAGFDLQTTLNADTGDGGEQLGPAATTPGVRFDDRFCGADTWPPAGVEDRLAVTVTGPEYAETRELVTFPDADHAVAALDAVQAAVKRCADGRLVQGRDENNVTFSTLLSAGAGYDDAATFVMTYEQGLGGDIYQLVRVGRAILATDTSAELALDSIGSSLSDLTAGNRGVTDQMCVFTGAGC